MTKATLDEIKQRHLKQEMLQGKTFYEGHVIVDMQLLVDEIERLKDLYEHPPDECNWETT